MKSFETSDKKIYNKVDGVVELAVKCVIRENYYMPTILFVMGWRFFFYSNEGNEEIS